MYTMCQILSRQYFFPRVVPLLSVCQKHSWHHGRPHGRYGVSIRAFECHRPEDQTNRAESVLAVLQIGVRSEVNVGERPKSLPASNSLDKDSIGRIRLAILMLIQTSLGKSSSIPSSVRNALLVQHQAFPSYGPGVRGSDIFVAHRHRSGDAAIWNHVRD